MMNIKEPQKRKKKVYDCLSILCNGNDAYFHSTTVVMYINKHEPRISPPAVTTQLENLVSEGKIESILIGRDWKGDISVYPAYRIKKLVQEDADVYLKMCPREREVYDLMQENDGKITRKEVEKKMNLSRYSAAGVLGSLGKKGIITSRRVEKQKEFLYEIR